MNPESRGAGKLQRASEHVRKYLILYTILSVAIALPIGYHSSGFTIANRGLLSNLVIFFAILTIYPSMIQLKTEGFVKSLKSWKQILVSLIYVFVLSPIIAFGLAPTFGNDQIGVGFVTANIVPASSASLGYVLIAGGSIELATALAVLSFVIAIPAIPLLLNFYGSQVSTAISTIPVLLSVFYILVLPFAAGQLTRYPLLRKKGSSFVNKTLRPYLSLATMLSMLSLIFVLVDKEASVMISKPRIVGEIIGYQSAIIVGILIVSILVSRMMHFSYEDHQAVAFISVTKNQSVAAAIATLALNPISALPPAIIPMIQPVIAIIYIHLEKTIKAFFQLPHEQPLERKHPASSQ
ncbi:MAG: arsenic resistance protein [Nitrososphaerota archaeon]|nr:arsenic resistance protein [Nitrososphaerota archaeon]